MWENTPASGLFQGGHYPSGPSASHVGTPARPMLDLLQGRNRMENVGGNSGGDGGAPIQQHGGGDGGRGRVSPPDPLEELAQWCKDNGLSAQTWELLKGAGCENLQGLRYLQCGDLERLGLPIIQLRILQKALGFSEPTARPPQPPGHEGGAAQGLQPTLPGLGIGVHPPGAISGARPGYTMQLDRTSGKVDYLDIVDHLPCGVGIVEEEEIGGGDGQTKILLRRGPQRVKLEKVTANQWNCANMMIMDKLNRDGKLGPQGLREYMNYTFIINELAGRYQWQSVLSYDREYRQLQARESFPWGSQVDHLSRILLLMLLGDPGTKTLSFSLITRIMREKH